MKNILAKIAVVIALLNALGELAVSQVHILASTKVFANEIGFYLFWFIILGLVTGFNAFLLEKRRGIIFFMVSSWLAAGSGFIYLRILLTDVAAQTAITIADVQDSRVLIIVSICILLIGSIVIPLLHWGEVEDA